jgi:phosphate transport system ATP-binding protein
MTAISPELAIRIAKLNLWYGGFKALHDVDFEVKKGIITSLIGPSGCGKSTVLRTINRMNERLGYVRTEGTVEVLGRNILDAAVELSQLRQKVGMVFQRPNPLPISIRENVLFGFDLHHADLERKASASREELLELALREVQLWDNVKDRLKDKATELSLEAQQKLCIARLLPLKPEVLLMDEPCSALDPGGTAAVEQLIRTLAGEYSIVIVTHNMAQARRASDECAFMLLGKLVEQRPTAELFGSPANKETADYIAGRFG